MSARVLGGAQCNNWNAWGRGKGRPPLHLDQKGAQESRQGPCVAERCLIQQIDRRAISNETATTRSPEILGQRRNKLVFSSDCQNIIALSIRTREESLSQDEGERCWGGVP